MKKKILAVLLCATLFACLLAGCGSNAPAEESSSPTASSEPNAESKGTINIGALLDYTGVVADYGPKFQAGIEAALEECNYKVAGYDLKLVTVDCQSDVATATAKYKDLVDKENVHLIVGPLMGDAHLAIAPFLKQDGVIVASLVNGMYDSIALSDNHYIIYPTTCEAQTVGIGKYAATTLGYKKAAVVCCNFAGKIAFTNGFKQSFTDNGGTIAYECYPDLGTSDYSSYVEMIPDDVDVVFYALNGSSEVSSFLMSYKASGKKIPCITCCQDADYTPEALTELGDLSLGVKGEASYSWQLDSPENKAFVAAMKAKENTNPTSAEQNAYTMTKMYIKALEITKGDDSYEAMWPAITSLQMETPAGHLSFESNGVAISEWFLTEAEKTADGKYQLSAPLVKGGEVHDWRFS